MHSEVYTVSAEFAGDGLLLPRNATITICTASSSRVLAHIKRINP